MRILVLMYSISFLYLFLDDLLIQRNLDALIKNTELEHLS